MKKGIVTLVAVIFVCAALLAGCGSGSGSTSSGSSPSGENSASAGGSAQNSEKVKLTFLSWYNEDSMKPLLDAFHQKYPNIDVELQFVPPVFEYEEKLKVLSIADETPDVFYLAAENRIEMIKNGYAMDISDQPFFDKLNPSNKAVYTVDGKTYAYAPDAWAGGFIYNKDLFAKVGAEPPKTWDQFLAVLDKLKKAGIRPIIERNDWLWTSLNSLFMNDVIATNPNYDEQVLNGEKTYIDGWKAPIEKWYNDLVKPGYLDKDLLGIGAQQFYNEFATGKAGMIAGHLGHLKEVKKINPNINAGVFPMVGTQEGTKYLYGGVNVGLAISSKTKHPKEALEFLNFISSEEGLKLYQKVTGFLLGYPGIDYEIDPAFTEIRQMYESGSANLYLPQIAFGEYSSAILNELVKGTQDVLAGGIQPAEVPARMDKKLQELKKK